MITRPARETRTARREHLNHLGIVAEVCREIGVAQWLDAHNSTTRQRVSVGTATVAMVLNGLGFSNRQLYLLPQFFQDKPVEHLLAGSLDGATVASGSAELRGFAAGLRADLAAVRAGLSGVE